MSSLAEACEALELTEGNVLSLRLACCMNGNFVQMTSGSCGGPWKRSPEASHILVKRL